MYAQGSFEGVDSNRSPIVQRRQNVARFLTLPAARFLGLAAFFGEADLGDEAGAASAADMMNLEVRR